MFVAAGDEHDADHQAQEQKSNIGELSELRERGYKLLQAASGIHARSASECRSDSQ